MGNYFLTNSNGAGTALFNYKLHFIGNLGDDIKRVWNDKWEKLLRNTN